MQRKETRMMRRMAVMAGVVWLLGTALGAVPDVAKIGQPRLAATTAGTALQNAGRNGRQNAGQRATQNVAANGTDNEEWTRTFPPFRIVGNIYWVGGYDLSTYLITTPQGNILINTGVGETAKQIAASVAQLGFKIGDTKILTATHGHIDHVAGLAELKKMTGAVVMMSERDKDLLESGGRTDFRFGSMPGMQFEPVTVDRTFKDGEKISLGGTELTAHLTAGHTKGATSFTLTVKDGAKDYQVVIANMPSINPGVKVSGMPGYPEIGQDYAKAFMALKDMKIDIWLASHASQFRMHEKYAPGAPYDPARFVDPGGFLQSVQRLEKTYLEQLEKERAGK
jgi:metallo-beta-lactamase class B